MENLRLNENQLKTLIGESVRLILKEVFDGDSDYVFNNEPEEIPDELMAKITDDDREEDEYYKELMAGEYNPSDYEYEDEPNSWWYN